MPPVVTVLIVIALLVLIAFVLRSGRTESSSGASTNTAPKAPKLNEVDFHVQGETAQVYFDTAIPNTGADSVLVDLMRREAKRVLEDKASHLPIDGVHRIVVHGKRGSDSVEVTTVDLREPAAFGDESMPEALSAADVDPYEDPLAELHAMDFDRSSGYRSSDGDDLPPLSDELKIPAKVVEAVAGAGGTVAGMSLQDFVAGLLRASGYEVSMQSDTTGTARKAGVTTFLEFVEHTAGSHPELADSAVDGFAMKVMSSGADRGMLFTPKFGPYAIYDKERRNAKVKYMTRERLQAFVDSVAMA